MNYQDFVLAHRKTGADITVAALPTDEKKATAFGLMKIDGSGRIVDFAEKPKGEALHAMRVDTTILGLDAERCVTVWGPGKGLPSLRSSGRPSRQVVLGVRHLRAAHPRGSCGRAKEEPYIASMGIYVAKASAIRDLLMKHYPQARSPLPPMPAITAAV